jgi:hypothetical protein
MAQASYTTRVKQGGTPVVFTDEATTLIVGTTYQYRINTAARRILAPSAVVKVNGATVTTGFMVNRLSGVITFAAQPSHVPTVDGSYIPVSTIAGAHEYSVSIGGELLDSTEFDGDGFRTRLYGQNDVSVSLSRFDDVSNAFKDLLLARSSLLIEIQPGAGSEYLRGWFLPESTGNSGGIGNLEVEELSFQLDGEIDAVFFWG